MTKKTRKNKGDDEMITGNIRTFMISIISIASIACSLAAIEIPLEGFGKTTNVAYVNMHKIFEAFPETEQARIELNRLIETKKAEMTAKKEEIAGLKSEIEILKKQMDAVAPSTAPKVISTEEPSAQKSGAAVSEEEKIKSEISPETATSLTLPEGSPLGFIFSPPQESTGTTSPEETLAPKPIVAVSTSGPQILPGIPSPAPQIDDKETLLSRKQIDLEVFIGAAEQEIRSLEEGKTMTLLARIYKSLEEISAKDGYSIILDRENILYGEGAVDITENVIWRLSSGKMKDKKGRME